MKLFQSLFVCLFTLSVLTALPVFAEDKQGCSDHSMMKRYAESEIIDCKKDEFDEYGLFIKQATEYGGKSKNLSAVLKLEGAVIRTTYRTPAERSTLEVFRNYQDSLKGAGFEVLFTCSSSECGGRNFNHAVVPYSAGFAENYDDQRFLSAKLKRDQGDVYVSLYLARNTSSGGPDHNRIFTQLDVIETRPMEMAMVKIDASEMADEIAETGSVALYGIYFDTDKTDIKPQSKPTLDEIAKLLNSQKALKLMVVGHTDNVGAMDYNMDLSRRRAQSVVKELVSAYGIDGNRLSAYGVGYLAPVAPNKTEAGRAKNRRVELVEQ